MLRWPEGVDRIVHASIGSTMTEAARVAASLTSPTWILAHVQTDARGRRGRGWLTPSGNLSATLVFNPRGSHSDAAQRSFVAANALYDALARYVPAESLSLKWPNDVLLNGGKVAGILLESSGIGVEINCLSIGFGVNLASTPEGIKDAAFAPTCLKDAGGGDVAAEEFLTALAVSYAAHEDVFVHHGFARIRADWLKHAARLGDVITARTSQAEITGVFDTIDEQGNLVLITDAGAQTIAAADVFF